MVDSTGKCADGWDPSELLAYLEGDLPPVRHKELEQHLAHCKACSSQMESLRQMDGILKACPQCFHPDEEELHRFVSGAEDPDDRVSAHLETCEDCREAVAVLREMLTVGDQIQTPPQPMPGALLRRLEARYPDRREQAEPTSRFALLLGWFRRPFSTPMLAAGTLAAALVVAAILVPVWTGRYVPKPETVPTLEKAPIQEVEKRKGTLRSQPPASDYPAKRSELHGMVRTPLPEAKPAPAPAATAPALERTEPLKTGEGLGESLATPKASAPTGTGITAPGRSFPAVKNRRGDFRAQGAPLLKEVPVQPSRPLQIVRDAHAKPKVMVRIVLPEGQEFEGVRFVAPSELKNKYSFIEQQTDKEEEKAESKYRRPQEAEITPGAGARYIVTVRLSQQGTVYGLKGSLSEPGAAIETKALSKDNIPRETLQLEINTMVTSLLQGR